MYAIYIYIYIWYIYINLGSLKLMVYLSACGLQAVCFESLSKLLDGLLDSYFCMLLVHGHILVEHFYSPPGSTNEIYNKHKVVVISNKAYLYIL